MRTSGRLAGPSMVVAAARASPRGTGFMRLLEGFGGGLRAGVAREVCHLRWRRETALADIVVEVVLLAAVAVNAWIRGIGNITIVRTVVGRLG